MNAGQIHFLFLFGNRVRAVILERRQQRLGGKLGHGKACSVARAIRRDAHAVYLAGRDPRTPWYAKALALCVAGYALSPIDLIPDFIPVLGWLDDAIIVPLGILAVVRMIPSDVMAEHRAAATAAAERPVSTTAAAVIMCIWAASIALTGWMAYRHVSAP